MNTEHMGVRISPALRALLDQAGKAGKLSAATRALCLIGAGAMGYDLSAAQADLVLLSSDVGLSVEVRAMLNSLLNIPLNTLLNIPERPRLIVQPAAVEADPFAGLGFEV